MHLDLRANGLHDTQRPGSFMSGRNSKSLGIVQLHRRPDRLLARHLHVGLRRHSGNQLPESPAIHRALQRKTQDFSKRDRF
ncbi:hypothetical protein CEXT_254461 [Caerostris extrusa]|uniref:Uncharacterized protein n=1 Tax=Caerostris extrusa TaxID=172846 RepID=A0AAV4SV86_CAEEX|nr:hypothetical protein CEXT_254461 [Caerostris extrusa]